MRPNFAPVRHSLCEARWAIQVPVRPAVLGASSGPGGDLLRALTLGCRAPGLETGVVLLVRLAGGARAAKRSHALDHIREMCPGLFVLEAAITSGYT